MTPDELRRALEGATPDLREALGEALAQLVAPACEPYYYGTIHDRFGAFIGLALLTDAQRADAWYAALDRVATGEGEDQDDDSDLAGRPVPGFPANPDPFVRFYDSETGRVLPPTEPEPEAAAYPAGSVGAFVDDLEQQVSDTRERMLREARRGGVQIVTRTVDIAGMALTIYGYVDTDGNERFPGV